MGSGPSTPVKEEEGFFAHDVGLLKREGKQVDGAGAGVESDGDGGSGEEAGGAFPFSRRELGEGLVEESAWASSFEGSCSGSADGRSFFFPAFPPEVCEPSLVWFGPAVVVDTTAPSGARWENGIEDEGFTDVFTGAATALVESVIFFLCERAAAVTGEAEFFSRATAL